MLKYMSHLSALVAQRIEQLPSKQWVVGSIPARGTIFFAQKKPFEVPLNTIRKAFFISRQLPLALFDTQISYA